MADKKKEKKVTTNDVRTAALKLNGVMDKAELMIRNAKNHYTGLIMDLLEEIENKDNPTAP